jgi:4-amino-4-deoxy-L-arabinose transferase-like glycosyltransferase
MNLETAEAGRTAALLFPGYYVFGLGAGALLLAAAAILARGGGRRWYGVALAVTIALACHAYATASVRPRMSELRGVPTGIEEFQRLHRVSVRLNTVVLIITFGLLCGSAKLLDRR